MVSPAGLVVLARHCGVTPPQWAHPDAPSQFAGYALAVAESAAAAPVRPRWLSFEGLGATAWRWCVRTPIACGRPLQFAPLVRCLDHMAAAHVLAYDAVKLHRPDGRIGVTAGATGVYELDRMVLDILVARSEGVGRFELGPWLAARRSAFNRATPPRGVFGSVVRSVVSAAVAGERALPTAVTAVYASAHLRPVDMVDI